MPCISSPLALKQSSANQIARRQYRLTTSSSSSTTASGSRGRQAVQQFHEYRVPLALHDDVYLGGVQQRLLGQDRQLITKLESKV